MAKSQTGLPEGFDIGITGEDLNGPASLPGYLDEDPVLELAKLQKQRAAQLAHTASVEVGQGSLAQKEEPPRFFQKDVPSPIRQVTPSPLAAQVTKEVLPSVKQSEPSPISQKAPPRARLQINLDAESERMIEELTTLLSSQSSEKSVKISELFQALVLSLYNARGEIVLGSLPLRGRWGSPSSKSFLVSLSEALGEAIVAHDKASGGNPFKKAVGG